MLSERAGLSPGTPIMMYEVSCQFLFVYALNQFFQKHFGSNAIKYSVYFDL